MESDMGIVGLAEWYSNKNDMRRSVFASRSISSFKLIQRACAECGIYENAPFYKDIRGFKADDKFGVKLWDALSYGIFDFENTVPKDDMLSQELGCGRSQCLLNTQIILGIYQACTVREKEYLISISENIALPRNLSQAYLRAAYAEIGDVIGVKYNLEALQEGALLRELLSPDELYRHVPSDVAKMAREQKL